MDWKLVLSDHTLSGFIQFHMVVLIEKILKIVV